MSSHKSGKKTTGNKSIRKGVSGKSPNQLADALTPQHEKYADQNNKNLYRGSNPKAGDVRGKAPNQLSG